ncbi:ABC transporter substrate-binding protein [Jiangella sp. DSM 45060]|uniref:ABC transporter substrate-binding protein n=1 Tax=Jiangella sp. DSM 45060 TaxID=1798224 RepID=UPI00087B152C|nr:extracellular solute-binding protein [Jiangella sp. DSM 45060]SDT22060.1 ABC-type glycerol-3-phosphate transport system, substrate-binding protein [Jiangella sp. DSM 45060]
MRTLHAERRLAAPAAAIALLCLAACGGGGSGDTSGDASGDVRLTMIGWNIAAAEETIAAFEEEHPGVTVEFRPYAYNDYLQALRPALTGNEGPDVFQVQPGGMLTNYEPLAADLRPHLEESLGEQWRDAYYEAGLEQLAYDDKQAALPGIMSAAGLVYYDQAVLDEAGVEVPTTFDEWETACAAVVATGRQCLAHGAKDAWVNIDVFLSVINSDAPGIVYDAIAGDVAWDAPEFVTAATEFASLFQNGIIAEGAASRAEYPDAFNEFVAGNAAFIALGTWNTAGTMTSEGLALSAEGISGEPSGPFYAAPFPAPQSGNDPTALFGGPDNGWAVSAQSAHPDEAYDLVEFLTHGGGQDVQASLANFPANTEVAISTADVVVPEQVQNIEEQQAGLADLVGARQIPYPDLEAALGHALSSIIADPGSIEGALAEVEQVSAGLDR